MPSSTDERATTSSTLLVSSSDSRETRAETPAEADLRRAPGEQGQRASNDDDDQEGRDEDAALRVGGERMHRVSTPERTRKVPSSDNENANGQHRPVLELPRSSPPASAQRGTRQPGHEQGVFHRVPEPPSTPAEVRRLAGTETRNASNQRESMQR